MKGLPEKDPLNSKSLFSNNQAQNQFKLFKIDQIYKAKSLKFSNWLSKKYFPEHGSGGTWDIEQRVSMECAMVGNAHLSEHSCISLFLVCAVFVGHLRDKPPMLGPRNAKHLSEPTYSLHCNSFFGSTKVVTRIR